MEITSKDTIARKIMGDKVADAYQTPENLKTKTPVKVNQEYIDSLPDLQNGENHIIKRIELAGMHNFKLPVTYIKKDETNVMLETSVTGSLSVEATLRGLNISRIIRTFYDHKNSLFSLDKLKEVLIDYQDRTGSFDAELMTKFSYPLIKKSLVSDNEGYIYYDVILEGKINKDGKFKKIMHLDYIYSSCCPCSQKLSSHMTQYQNIGASPHSQRSAARISIEFDDMVWIEDVVDMCREVVPTEVQIIVKREDEQYFASLNYAHPVFVEDASRLFADRLDKDNRIKDYKVVCSHNESLHPNNVHAVIVKGIPGGFDARLNRDELMALGSK